jgi:hypothetical protein
MYKTLIYIVIILSIFFLFKSTKEREKFIPTSKATIANDILQWINVDRTYLQYADFMKGRGNLSYKLISPKTFYEMIEKKRNNQLSESVVTSYMDDWYSIN